MKKLRQNLQQRTMSSMDYKSADRPHTKASAEPRFRPGSYGNEARPSCCSTQRLSTRNRGAHPASGENRSLGINRYLISWPDCTIIQLAGVHLLSLLYLHASTGRIKLAETTLMPFTITRYVFHHHAVRKMCCTGRIKQSVLPSSEMYYTIMASNRPSCLAVKM